MQENCVQLAGNFDQLNCAAQATFLLHQLCNSKSCIALHIDVFTQIVALRSLSIMYIFELMVHQYLYIL